MATRAKSLLTQMVIANSSLLASFTPASGVVTAGRDVVAVATLAAPAGAQAGAAAGARGLAAPGRKVTSDAILVPNPVGLHARPAAVLAKLAAQYDSDISLTRGQDRANAKSVMAIMGMEVGYGDKVQVNAFGADADQAVADLAAQIRSGLGEEGVVQIAEGANVPEAQVAERRPEPSEAGAPAPRRRSSDPNLLLGAAASPGLGVGTVVQIRHEDLDVREESNDRHRERRRLNDAIDRSLVQLEALEDRLKNEADADKAAIFAAHREILRDPDLPSVAVMAQQFAAEVDFFSVGTNDLTQYTLAMDRGHPRLAPQVDGLNPAVLGLIALAVTAAHAAGKWVGVCGGIASDPQAVPILVGLGVDELSVSVPAIPAVKAQIRSLTLSACRELAARALTADSAASVRALVPTTDDEEGVLA